MNFSLTDSNFIEFSDEPTLRKLLVLLDRGQLIIRRAHIGGDIHTFVTWKDKMGVRYTVEYAVSTNELNEMRANLDIVRFTDAIDRLEQLSQG